MNTSPAAYSFCDKIKLTWVHVHWQTANFFIRATRFVLFKKNIRPKKILVFRTGSIGDSICAMPAILNIRAHFPDAAIHLLTNAGKGRRNLISIEAFIKPDIFDAIINYENLTPGEIVHHLRAEKFDLVIHLTQYFSPVKKLIRDMVFFRFIAAIPAGFGWRYEGVTVFRQTQEKHLRFPNERERLNKVLEQNGVATCAKDQFLFNIDASDILHVNTMLDALPLTDRPAIAIVPGAKRPQNRWPISHFEAVVQHFCSNFDIYFIGGTDDELLARPLLKCPNTHSFCGQLTPVQSGLLMRQCQLVLSNDTGPMHLAYAFDVPVVALFSNRDFPHRWFPPEGSLNAVLRATDVHCSVCLSETCTNNICMKKIAPQEVITRIEHLLEKINSNNLCAVSQEQSAPQHREI